MFCMKLTPEQSSDLLLKFENLGVTLWSDLKFLDTSDLKDVLKKVQAKKLMNSWAVAEVSFSSSSAACCSAPKLLSNCGNSDNEWDSAFNVPWQSFPKNLGQACENGKRPAHRDCLEMIRILVDIVLEFEAKPKK